MSRINEIQTAILALSGGAYQKMMDTYLYKKFSFSNITPLGSQSGTDKTTKGTPDSYVKCDDGRYILIAYGSVTDNSYKKIEKDIKDCLNIKKTGIEINKISKIICCHTSTNISISQTQKIYSMFSDIELIGLGDVSYDICYNHPDIAKEHLMISFDTNQIFELSAFLEYSAKNPYGTSLKLPLMCREQEMSSLMTEISNNDIVLVFGNSGIGKTRISIEACKEYSRQNNYEFRIIKSNGEDIYEDARIAFSNEKNHVILIDDANELSKINHVVDLYLGPRKNSIKIIMTVRDYARKKLEDSLKQKIKYTAYELLSLDKEKVLQILDANYEINNAEIQNRIFEISKGNIRLAVMASECVKEGRFEAINNAVDLYDHYFSPVIDKLDRKEILIAAIIALFDRISFDQLELPLNVLSTVYEIRPAEFVDMSIHLHDMELVDVFSGKAVKFENQNLRDYLLFLVFIKEKLIGISELINIAFPKYRKQIVFGVNTLNRLFCSKTNNEYITSEIKKSWSYFKDSDEKLEFIAAFHQAIPDESLSSIKKEIEQKNTVFDDLLKYDFQRNSNNHHIDSEIIRILISYKGTDSFEDAVLLALYYFEHTQEYPMDLYFLFNKEWSIDKNSLQNSYANEIKTIDLLTEYYSDNKTLIGAFALLFYSSGVLRFEYELVEPGEGNQIVFSRFYVVRDDNVDVLREKAIDAILLILADERMKKNAENALLLYPAFVQAKAQIGIIENDIAVIAKNQEKLKGLSSFQISHIVNRFETIADRYHIEWPCNFQRSKDNPVYATYLDILPSRAHKYLDYHVTEKKRKERVFLVAKDVPEETINLLWVELKNNQKILSDDSWEICRGIELLFQALVQLTGDKFINCCDAYIANGTPFDSFSNSVVNGLVKHLGFKGAYEYVTLKEFTNKNIWKKSIFEIIPDSLVNEMKEQVMESIGPQETTIAPMSVDSLIKMSKEDAEFFIAYMDQLAKISEKKPYLLADMLLRIGQEESVSAQEFVGRFTGNEALLLKIYVDATIGRPYFDNEGILFIEMVRRIPSFIEEFIISMIEKGVNVHNISCMGIIWNQPDYIALVDSVMEAIRKAESLRFVIFSLGEEFLKKGTVEKRKTWIDHYIETNSANEKLMTFIFEIVGCLSEDEHRDAIEKFCGVNDSFKQFDQIPLFPRYTSWVGSEAAYIESRVLWIEQLCDRLKGYKYIEHRGKLKEIENALQEKKEEVLLKEFMNER